MGNYFREILARRPTWMNLLLGFCAYMAIVYVPWDLFAKPLAEDAEVWFGVAFHGWAAKLLAVPHWIVYAAGAYGFWRMRPWMWPWAAVYAAQVAIGFAVWPVLAKGGALGYAMGAAGLAAFAVPTVALWRAKQRFRPPPKRLRERYGEWALVTGASAGIGAEFARALAREGLNVVLTARREERLRDLAAELEKGHQVATRIVVADLARPGDLERLVQAVADLEVGVLVNNAGWGYSGRLTKQEPERLREMIEVNCIAPTLLARKLLKGMTERGHGAVIFTGSVAGRQPLPLHAVYAATKAFDLFLGEALWGELRGSGVDVVVLEPGSTATEFQAVAGELPHPGEPPEKVVRVALDALGKQPSVTSGWFNWLRSSLATRLGPRSLVVLVARDHMERQTPEAMR
jgi:short-subunit dehydrogenase